MTHPDRKTFILSAGIVICQSLPSKTALHDFVYSGKDAWQQFLKILFLSLGAGFLLAGLIFFFAYNWDALHKFVKLGIIEGLIILFSLTLLLIRNNNIVRKILLTAASVMVGVLFAVFGQVYQTGADAFDLFLNWTACITLWVIVAEFAPLWLIWIALVNISIQFYLRQLGPDLPEMTAPLLLFLVNTISLVASLLLKHFRMQQIPQWFIIVLTLASATIATIGVGAGIFNDMDISFSLLLLTVIISYMAGIYYAFRQHSIFFVAVTGCSIIIILSAGILRISDSTGSVLFICLFLGASITLLIKSLLTLQKNGAMKKQPEIAAILDTFRMRESEVLQIDEPAAIKAYEKANADRSGIAIKVLTVVGGFLVTCAFLGFLFLAGFYNSGSGLAITGFLFVAGALVVKNIRQTHTGHFFRFVFRAVAACYSCSVRVSFVLMKRQPVYCS